MEEQSKTWIGVTSNISDAWTSLQADFMDKSGMFDALKEGAKEVKSFAESVDVERVIRFGEAATATALIVGGYTAALKLVNVASGTWGTLTAANTAKVIVFGNVVGGSTAKITASTVAMRGFAVASRALTFATPLAAIAALMYAMDDLNESYARLERIEAEREKASKGHLGHGMLIDLQYEAIVKKTDEAYAKMQGLENAYRKHTELGNTQYAAMYKKQAETAKTSYDAQLADYNAFINKYVIDTAAAIEAQKKEDAKKAELDAKYLDQRAKDEQALLDKIALLKTSGIERELKQLEHAYRDKKALYANDAEMLAKLTEASNAEAAAIRKKYADEDAKERADALRGLQEESARILQEYGDKIIKEYERQQELKKQANQKYFDYIQAQTNTRQSLLDQAESAIADPLDEATKKWQEMESVVQNIWDTEKMNKFYKAMGEDLEKVADVKAVEEIKLSDTISSQLGNSVADAIQGAFEGDFDFGQIAGSFANAIGTALIAQVVAAQAAAALAAGTLSAGAAAGLGVGAIGVGAILGGAFTSDGSFDKMQAEYFAKIDEQTADIVNTLNEQTKILAGFGDNLKALSVSLSSAQANFMRESNLNKGDPYGRDPFGLVGSSSLSDYLDRFSEYYRKVIYEPLMKGTVSMIGGFTKSTAEQLLSTEQKRIDYVINTYSSPTQSLGSASRASYQALVGDILEVNNSFKGLSESLKTVYDSVNDNYYANLELSNSYNILKKSSLFAKGINDSSFSESVFGIITELDNFDSSISELKDNLLSSDLKTQIKAIYELEKATGESFNNNASNALDYLDAIEMVGAAMASSQKNIKSFADSFKTETELLEDMRASLSYTEQTGARGEWIKQYNAWGRYIGTTFRITKIFEEVTPKIANTYEELQELFNNLQDGIGGLTDAELEFLEANKALIDANEATMRSLVEFADGLTALGSGTEESAFSLSMFFNALDGFAGAQDKSAAAEQIKQYANDSVEYFRQSAQSGADYRFNTAMVANAIRNLDAVEPANFGTIEAALITQSELDIANFTNFLGAQSPLLNAVNNIDFTDRNNDMSALIASMRELKKEVETLRKENTRLQERIVTNTQQTRYTP